MGQNNALEPFFSVIIPTHKRNDLLGKCLERLAPGIQTLSEDKYEVIVTDDSSSGEAKTLIEGDFPWCKWVAGPQKGPAANRNNGVKYTKGKWLIFTDDDCLPENNWLEEYSQAIAKYPDILTFEGAIYPDSWELLKKDMANCPINTKGDCFWSANIGINRSIFSRVGGFDEDFIIAAQEDQDLYIRVKKLTKVIFLKNAKIIHPVRRISIRKEVLNTTVKIKNYIIYAQKHNFYDKIYDFFLSRLKGGLINIIKSILEKKTKKTLLHIWDLFVSLPISVYVFTKRKNSPRKVKIDQVLQKNRK